ncbi:MAG: fatty acid desaturase [Planctomycetaceae bacterium]|nr:fatty acid desaturase [Planctomycetaceae bacterium]
MRLGKELLVASKEFAIEQRYRSWWCLLSTLILYFISLAAIVASPSWMLSLPCSVLSGLLVVRIFIIYHDFQHGTILTRSWLARGILDTFGVLVLCPASIWNRSHNHHHAQNSKIQLLNVGSFPIMTLENYKTSTAKQRLSYAFSRHPLTIMLGYLTIFFWGISLRSFWVNPREHYDAGIAVLVHLLLVGFLLWYAPAIALFAVIIPLVIACGTGSYLFYAQHNFPGVRLFDKEHWNYVAAAIESSSYMKMGPIMHWFTGNIGYHHVHHLNAKIPFYRLPEAMAAIPEMQAPKTTSLSIMDIYKCFRLKVWDAQRQMYLTFAEAAEEIARNPQPAVE